MCGLRDLFTGVDALTCTAARHQTCSHAHKTCTKSKVLVQCLGLLYFKFSLCKQHAECLIQWKIHHCTIAPKLVSQWAYLSNQQFYASYAGMSARVATEYQHCLYTYPFNMWWVLHFRGNDGGRGLKETARISRNQTFPPVALMLMMMRRDSAC